MSETQKNISTLFVASLAFTVCIIVVAFEATQQFLYLKTFQPSSEIAFFDLVLSQTRKWLIWVIYAIPLCLYVEKCLIAHDNLNMSLILESITVILALLVLVIVTISFIEILVSGYALNSIAIWLEFLMFLVFQKTPIYLVGYTFLALVFYLYFKNNLLTIQILTLSELNQKELKNFYKSKTTENQNTSVLKIKVGYTYKIVAVEDIDWIEADDYCVNIHNKSSEVVYSMRATLKSLESQLPDSFLRVHRSAIVNMTEVKEYSTQGTGVIKMKSGDEIIVAQSKLKMVNDFFNPEML